MPSRREVLTGAGFAAGALTWLTASGWVDVVEHVLTATGWVTTGDQTTGDQTINGTVYTLSEPTGGAAGQPIATGSDVSINIFDNNGVLVRTLFRGERLAWGTYNLADQWNGLNDAGVAVPAGNYTARILQTQGLRTHYEGLNVGSAMIPGYPYLAMPGNHNGVAAALLDGGRLYLTSPGGESTANQLALDATTYAPAWSAYNHTWMGGTALVVGIGYLFALHQDGNVGPTPLNFTALDEQRPQTFYTDVYADRALARHAPHFFEDGLILDMDGRMVGATPTLDIAISYTKNNRVKFWNQSTTAGAEHTLVDSGIVATVTAPTGIGMAPDGTVYCITEGRVVKFSRAAPTPVEVIPATALTNPWRIKVATDGTLLILEASKWAQWAQLPAASADPKEAPHYRVRRFTAAGALVGNLAHTRNLGGAYAPTNGLYGTFNIAADEAGGFIVTEPFHSPRKTARHNSDGTIRKVWHGPQVYSNAVFPDPIAPDRYWMVMGFGELTEITVDHAADTWTPRAVYPHAGILGIVPEFDPHNVEPIQGFVRNGVRYLAVLSNLQLFQIDEPNGRLLPLAIGFLRKQATTAQEQAWGIFKDGAPYIWTATSPGDFSTDISRVRKATTGTQGHARYTLNEGDQTLTFIDRYGPDPTNAATVNRVARMVPVWNANGVPVYPLWDGSEGNVKYYGPIPNTNEIDIAAGSVQGPYDGLLYVSFGGPLSRVEGNLFYFLTCIRMSDNKVLWQVGKANPDAQADANGVNTANGTVPLADGDVAQSMRLAPLDTRGYSYHVDMDAPLSIRDRYGLWVGRWGDFKDPTQPAAVFRVANQMHGGTIEMVGAEVRVIPAAYNTAPIFRFQGWDKFQRKTLNFTR